MNTVHAENNEKQTICNYESSMYKSQLVASLLNLFILEKKKLHYPNLI